ncbi:MAG TPA: extracellular solute-binding protein [Phycisphaerales bacterium]
MWRRVLIAMLAACVATGVGLASCERDRRGAQAIEVEFWTLALATFGPYIRGEIAAFEAAHPGVKVRWVDVPFSVLERKLISAAAAGRAPDVVNMSDVNYARFASLGAFIDLNPLVPPEGSGDVSAEERYLPGALFLCKVYSEPGARKPLLALPWYVNPQASIINTELLRAGGLTLESLPKDWRGVLALAHEFRMKTGKFLISQPLGEESQLPVMLLGEGLVPLKPRDAGDPAKGLEADLTRPEVRDYIALWVEAFRRGDLPRAAATQGHSHLLDLYQEQSIAVISTGPNFLKNVRDVSPRVFANSTVREDVRGSLGRAHMPIMVLSVTSQSRHPREAAALAWWMTGPRAQLAFSKIVPIMPSTAGSAGDAYFRPSAAELSGPDGVLALARKVVAESLPHAVGFTAALETWPDLRRSFEEAIKRVLVDGADLDATLGHLNEEWNRILGEAPPATMDAVPRPERVP